MDPISLNTEEDPFTQILPSNIQALHSQLSSCHLCDLSKSRQRVLTGVGNVNADLMFIDAYPSMVEDESGDSFSGRSGTSLKNMIENVLGMNSNAVYLTHILKCKPSENHKILETELSSCKPYLLKQIELINPKVIVTLGDLAYINLVKDESDFEKVRGQVIPFEKKTLIPIYHPSYLLRNPSLKKCTMQDLHLIKKHLTKSE